MRLFALGLAFITVAQTQPWYEAYLLKEPVLFRGDLVDQEGHRLAGVRAYGLELGDDVPSFVQLRGHSQFEFRTRSPSVVFRKAGYQSQFVRVAQTADMKVVMKAIGEPVAMPMCPADADCASTGVFCLPRIEGIEFGKVFHGIDASLREVRAPSISGPKTVLTHGSGTSWHGEPSPQHLWESVEYSEDSKRVQDLLVIDARGKDEDGLMWRSIGIDYERHAGRDPFHMGERVDYGSRTPDEAALLDRVIDGICATPPRR